LVEGFTWFIPAPDAGIPSNENHELKLRDSSMD